MCQRYDSQDGSTGLQMAAQNGHLEVVRLLLDSRADLNLAREVSPPFSLSLLYYLFSLPTSPFLFPLLSCPSL
jgi:ankyrin repeat protein